MLQLLNHIILPLNRELEQIDRENRPNTWVCSFTGKCRMRRSAITLMQSSKSARGETFTGSWFMNSRTRVVLEDRFFNTTLGV